MKREGRQHGSVRTCPIILPPSSTLSPRPPQPKHIYSSCTAGPFARVSSKPTNHSKFTGKCGRAECPQCQVSCKAKGKKAKGTLKQRTADGVADNKSIAWRVEAAAAVAAASNNNNNYYYYYSNNYKFSEDDFQSGFSATGILDHLDGLDYTYDLEAAEDDDE